MVRMDTQAAPIDFGTVLLYLAIAAACWLVFWVVRGWLRTRIHATPSAPEAGDLATATFPIAKPGYKLRDVDRFLDQVQAWLTPTLADADRATALNTVTNVRFAVARSGYDPRAVDTHLDALIARFSPPPPTQD
jgi:DivIVA domain-containing protein